MQTFPGQTEQNAVARAMPVVQDLEARIQLLHDPLQ
jgi:hypothetical protein